MSFPFEFRNFHLKSSFVLICVASTFDESFSESLNLICYASILVYEDGTGYDLEKVVTDKKPLEAITHSDENGLVKFYYNPCGDIKDVPGLNNSTENDCAEGYTLCMVDIKDKKAVILGTQANMEFRLDKDVMEILFINHSRAAYITLMCTEKDRGSVLYAPLEKIDPDQVVRNPSTFLTL